MLQFCLKSIAQGVLVVLLAVTTIFLLVKMAPGDPTALMLGPRATPETIEALRVKLGLDQPVYVQIIKFLGGVLQGDLGVDYKSQLPVWQVVMAQFPSTVALVLAAVLFSAAIGIPLGCLSAVKANSLLDRLIGALSVGMIAIPPLILAIYGMLIFAVGLRWFPAIGVGETGNPVDQLHHLVLPAMAVGLGWVGYLARIVRSSMLEILNEDYITNARAFGIAERRILFRYALRLAVAPVITLLGVGVGYMLGSAVFAEIVFARPGIGKLTHDAVISRNYPVTLGVALISTILLVTATVLSDILNAIIDPRIREAQT